MDIAIIGAGFSGVALARGLVQRAAPGTRIVLLGHAHGYGRGVAYGTPYKEHCLNVRACDLGIDPAAPASFADWLELESPTREGFLPRMLYGDYLAEQLDAAVTWGESRNVRLQCVQADVVSVERVGDGFRIALADGGTVDAARVVLAPGALPPLPMRGLADDLVASPNYIATPFSGAALERIAPEASVLVIGTGLTFADVAISLRRRGHRGRIDAVSRHGLAPLPHALHPSAPLTLPPELQRAWQQGNLRDVLRGLREVARDVDDWRRVIDALRPDIQGFWQRLDVEQRRRFLRHLRSYWDVHRHRIAPQLHEELQAMRDSGQLQIHAGRLLHAGLERGKVVSVLRDRGASSTRTVTHDVLLRATGLEVDVNRTRHALLVQLREAGLVRPDALGLGLQTDADGTLLDREGQRVPGLHLLGPLQCGQLWEIIAIPELRRAAVALATHLTSEPAPSADEHGATDTSLPRLSA